MTFGKSTFRAAAIAMAIAVVCTIPAIAMAATGDNYNTAEPITLPAQAERTLTVTPEFGTPLYFYSVDLVAGQTISATFTASPSRYLAGDAESDDFEHFPSMVWSYYVNDSVQHLSLMAPTAGKYYLVASGSNVGTFSIDASTVDTLTFTIGSESLPTSAKAKKKFTVSAKVKKVYDGLTVPVRFYITKKASNGKYKPFTSKLASSYGDDELGAYTKYSLKTSLSKKGTYRIRARFQDVAHKAIYTSNKTIKIK